MSAVKADRFVEFYRAMSVAIAQLSQLKETGGERTPPEPKDPFPWQTRIANRVSDPANEWPDDIALPTAAGKTACIEIAIFAMACQARMGKMRTAPRRIFFVVDRRIVVDQAFQHAKNIAKVLSSPQEGILGDVAQALRELAGDPEACPLHVFALRGGMYRETAWIRSPLQPMVIASTVDQVGSRLLFRGYGVSDSMKPVHAGLVGNDALILLDEAHCAKPFQQTISYVQKYRQWGDDDARPPFRFVSITATPNQAGDIVRDEADDRAHPVLGPRIIASKPAALVVVDRAKGKTWKNWGPPLVDKLAEQAQGLLGVELGPTSNGQLSSIQAVGVIVNRVATARELSKKLTASSRNKDGATSFDVILLTGRMRPVDRDEVLKQLEPLLSGARKPLEKPVIVVATQCLEVGADLDFHALVTECASLDSLRQRFGRLNRIAARPTAKAVIVVRTDQTEDSSTDPVYGSSLAATWKWLNTKATAEVFDFGVAAVRKCLEGVDVAPLNAPSLDAPVMFPAHLDCWVQTHPIPVPDPEPSLFLHGPQTGVPDVQVVFRADLGGADELWPAIVSLCPPTSAEAVLVRIDGFRNWLADAGKIDDSSDIEGEIANGDDVPESRERKALKWCGPTSETITDPHDVRPGDTYVVSTSQRDLESLCDFRRDDGGQPIIDDCGDMAFQRSRDRAILRLPDFSPSDERDLLGEDEFNTQLTSAIEACSTADSPEWMKLSVENLRESRHRSCLPHPAKGWVVIGKRRLHQFDPGFLDDAESSKSPTQKSVSLDEHSRGVAKVAERFAQGCGLETSTYLTAGFFHDIGKLDPRFQAMLRGCTPLTAHGAPLAKSANYGSADRSIHQYPSGARHELLSAALLATKTDDDLLLHLIVTHHGAARPFAPAIEENSSAKRPFEASLFGEKLTLESSAQTPTRWNVELSERFWRIVRKYGWWGAAYREAIFRLADHEQSRTEQDDESKQVSVIATHSLPARSATSGELHAVELGGLDGSNPLAFLSALGTFRLADNFFAGQVRLSWVRRGQWTPVLHLPPEVSIEQLIEQLHQFLHRVSDPAASSRADTLHTKYRAKKKIADQAMQAIKDQQLRGPDRTAAVELCVLPLRNQEVLARSEWLQALEASVPVPFLSLGKSLSVTADEFRAFSLRTIEDLFATGPTGRFMADFGSAFGCDALSADSGRIIPTEFQLITGSGHQFFLETIKDLMEVVSSEQLKRALIGPWAYQDSRLSFRWDPLDDRRYAYGWSDPSGEIVRTEHGANLLAAFAIPMYPAVPTLKGLHTTGFNSVNKQAKWTWPIWTKQRSLDAVRTLLAALPHCYDNAEGSLNSSAFAVDAMFCVRKIEIGQPPLSKLNLSPAVLV